MRANFASWMKQRRRAVSAVALLCCCLGIAAAVLSDKAWLAAARLLMNSLGADIEPILTKVLFIVGGKPVRVLFVIKSVVYLCFLNFVAGLAQRRLMAHLSGNPRFDKHQRYLLSKMVAVAVFLVGLIAGVRIERIDFTTLTIIGGALGVAVGVGVQGIVGNFISGLILLTDRTIRLGDYIEIGGRIGEAVRLGPRNVSIRTDDNALVTVPNSQFITTQVLNWTADTDQTRVSVSVPVPHGTNPTTVRETLLAVAGEHPDVLAGPAPSVIVIELRPQAVLFSLRVWTRIPARDFCLLQSDLNIGALERLSQAGIRMPAIQIDYNL